MKNLIYLAFAPLLLCIISYAFTGCAQLQRIEVQNQHIQSKLDTLNYTIESLSLSQGGQTRQIKTDLSFLLQDLKEQISRLHSQLDESQYRLKKLENTIATTHISPKPGISSQKKTKETKQLNTQAPNNASLDVKTIYHQAREDYIIGKYDLALKGFQTVYTQDLSTNFKDNALYWIGEIFYKKKDYSQAIKYYNQCTQEFPKGNKTCAALFKKGLSFEQQGNLTKRNQSWKQLQNPTCKGSNESLQALDLMKNSLKDSI